MRRITVTKWKKDIPGELGPLPLLPYTHNSYPGLEKISKNFKLLVDLEKFRPISDANFRIQILSRWRCLKK